MIVFTTGSSEPFDRLVAAADDVAASCKEPVLVQGGRSRLRPQRADFVDFLPYEELRRSIADARAVVAHAGVGSTLVALSEGCRPVIVPRLRKLGEAVDDHQLAFGRRMHALGLACLVEDTADLPAVLAAEAHTSAIGRAGEPSALALALREDLERFIGRPMDRRGPR